ncbi:MAG: J domain-containing protein [Actinomycetota bacterium]|nr:J domain-containing protein [Actinomycetota bacterium]
MTHYEVLGVSRSAGKDEIRRAYVTLARTYHPDFHTSDDAATKAESERRMQALNQAWEVLSDPTRRRNYDLELAVSDPAPRSGKSNGARRTNQPPPQRSWQSYAAPGAGATQRSFRSKIATLAPLVFLGCAVLFFLTGLLLRTGSLVRLAMVALVLGLLSFVVLPLLAMSESRRREVR